jgi:uncharacterized protein (DUF1015 family)
MPRFAAFPGLRYATYELALVTAPPYDVLSEAERDELAGRHPANVVHVDLPRDGDDPYREAGRTLERWLDDGTLVRDDPSLYLYRMTFTDEAGREHHTLGVLGALGLGDDDVLPHEHTTPKAKSDRLQLLRGTEANLSPIWGLSLASGLSKLLDTDQPSLGAWADADGVEHELWRVSDPTVVDDIVGTVESAPIVIADGHHRYETSLAFAAERPDLPAAASTLAFVVELVDDQLTVQPIHRLLRGDIDLTGAFDILPANDAVDGETVARLIDRGSLGLLTRDGFAYLHPRSDDGRIDSELLADALAGTEVDVTYQHGVANVASAVADGDADAAVLLRPVSVAQIQAVARSRGRMQPKSTFFWPKPRTGAVLRSLRG